jgi:hypothetical protein
MRTKTLALAASLALALTGSAFAQTPAGGGASEGNLNNPGSVKSNSEKGMERSTGSATMAPGGTGGSATMPGAGTGGGMDTAAPTAGQSGGTSSGGTAR